MRITSLTMARLRRSCFTGIAVSVVAGVWAVGAAQAQDAGGFTSDPNEPIEIVSDTAEWKRKENVAIFSGRVDAVQGTMRLRADQVFVHYVQKDASADAAEPDGDAAGSETPQGQSITKIDAKGNVIITDEEDRTANGDWALYDVKTRRIFMGDTVVLTQGDNVIRGQKLVMNLDSGETVLDAGTAGAGGTEGGRVRSLFVPADEATGP